MEISKSSDLDGVQKSEKISDIHKKTWPEYFEKILKNSDFI